MFTVLIFKKDFIEINGKDFEFITSVDQVIFRTKTELRSYLKEIKSSSEIEVIDKHSSKFTHTFWSSKLQSELIITGHVV